MALEVVLRFISQQLQRAKSRIRAVLLRPQDTDSRRDPGRVAIERWAGAHGGAHVHDSSS
jgi:hypothetical protein